MIKILTFCAALLAPESVGLSAHEKSLHFKPYTDYNTSYTACIATVKQAQKHGVDPFVSTALMYDIATMTHKHVEWTHAIRRVFELHNCEPSSHAKGSCSAHRLIVPYFANLLNQTQQHEPREAVDYRQALCSFYAGNETCKPEHYQKVKLIESTAQYYARLYSHSDTSFEWQSPFAKLPPLKEGQSTKGADTHYPRRGGMASGCGTGDPVLDKLVDQLGYASQCDLNNYNNEMNKGVILITSILGSNIHLKTKALTHPAGIIQIKYTLFMSYENLKIRLKNISKLRLGDAFILKITELSKSDFAVEMQLQSSQARMEFYRQADQTYSVSIHWY